MSARAPAIEATGLRKSFGAVIAVDDLSLDVPSAQVFGFLGPNGSGKTTTIRMLLGLTRPDAGHVRIGGHDITTDRLSALRSVGSLIEAAALYPHLTARTNLSIAARLLGIGRKEIDRVLDVVDLTEAGGRRVRGFSLGMRQRLALARALLGEPRLLVLDEPTNGLDPEGIAEMRALLTDLPTRTGATVFVSSHLLTEVQQVATRVAILRGGTLVKTGAVRDLLGEALVRFVIDDPHAAVSLLREVGATELGPGRTDGAVIARPPHGTEAEERRWRGAVVARLVANGVAVYEVAPVVRTLEDVYGETS